MSEQNGGEGLAQNKTEDLRTYILDHWQLFQGSLEQHHWLWETSRWHELVFCLLLRLGQPELEIGLARSLVNMLAALEMLRVETLAGLALADEGPNFTQPDLILMVRLLERAGLNPEKARVAVTTLCQAALGLQQQHGGKVQRYLRHYGQHMLDELGEHFFLSQMRNEDVRYAFTHWLQNVLNMPLPISDPAVGEFCKEQGVTVDELVQAADELDLNLALLDDLIVETNKLELRPAKVAAESQPG